MKRSTPTVPSRVLAKKDDNAVICESCRDVVAEDDAGKLACQSSHTLCGECSAVFCESIMAAGPSAVAPNAKCCICRGPIPSLSLERVLTPEQLGTYLSYVAIHTLQEGEQLVGCVNCSYCEVWKQEPSIFFCRACGVAHCVGCHTKLPRVLEESDIEDSEDEEAFEEAQAAHLFHLQCSALREEKAAFDLAIKSGAGMPCPSCGVIGRKDGMCTHMLCEGCNTAWCYLCGLDVDSCNKAPRRGAAAGEPLYGHNEDWKTNPGRCPMYMSMIAEVDDTWDFQEDLEDSDGEYDEEDLEEMCLDKFHRWRTLQNIHELRKKLGETKWGDLSTTFASVRNCSFSDQEIRNAGNIPLFTRPERPRTRQRVAEAAGAARQQSRTDEI